MSTEFVHYSREEVENIIRHCAMLKLVGRFYVGEIGKQELRWNEDGGVEVLTHHVPGTLPQATAQPPRPKRRYRKRSRAP